MVGQESKVLAALSKAQQKFTAVVRDAENPAFKRGGKVSKYATLESVIQAVRPSLVEEGLILIQKNIFIDGLFGVESRLIHIESGEEVNSRFIAPLEKQNSQGVASILTYARRYEYITLLGLVMDDDDGNSASGVEVRSEQSSKTAKKGVSRPVEPSKQTEPAKTPTQTESAPKQPETANTQNVTNLPTDEEYDSYLLRSRKIALALQDIDNKAGYKLVKFITKVAGAESLVTVSKDKWEIILKKLEAGVETDVKTLMKVIDERIGG